MLKNFATYRKSADRSRNPELVIPLKTWAICCAILSMRTSIMLGKPLIFSENFINISNSNLVPEKIRVNQFYG